MKCIPGFALACLLAGAPVAAQDDAAPEGVSFEAASADVRARLEASVAELEALYEELALEKMPLDRELGELEAELTELRRTYDRTEKERTASTVQLTNLQKEISTREEEVAFASSYLADYIRNLKEGLHVAEVQRWEEPLEAALLAPENENLSELEVFEAQAALLDVSIDRIFEALGGVRFEGRAICSDGLVRKGDFLMVGYSTLFRSADGLEVGTAEKDFDQYDPVVVPFADPADAEAASDLVATGAGLAPIDTTQGNAHKIAATKETVWEHIQKGGPVMVPILGMAALALLVALVKWIGLTSVRKPSKKRVAALLEAVGQRDEKAAAERARQINGPAGAMLAAGVAHMNEPRELVEEVMYEKVLTTRLELQRWLPFIAICAASAPLLGLLGTVTGIISTFKMLTVYGAGDVKALSSGISVALITTEFGLIVAIPSLLMHSFLSRKARGVVDQLERTGVAFVNQVSLAHSSRARQPLAEVEISRAPAPDPELVRAQVNQILNELLGPLVHEGEQTELARTPGARSS